MKVMPPVAPSTLPYERTAPTPTKPSDETTAAARNEHAHRRHGHGRRHVQRELHQLDRVIRQAVKDAVKTNDVVDAETRDAIRGMAKAFRADLQATFHEAGRGHDFVAAGLLTGVADAAASFAEALRGLVPAPEATPAATPPADEPATIPVDDPTGAEPGVAFSVLA